MKKNVWIFILTALFIFLTRSILLGAVLEPILSKKLTDLFGMPVTIRGLQVDPLSGHVQAAHVVFMNQPEFAPKPHLDVQGIWFDIDWRALKKKHVLIETIFLKEPFYFIDRIMTPRGPNNNVSTWVDHIEGPEEENRTGGSSGWKVTIHRMVLHNGTFIFHDRSSQESAKKLVFQKLDGALMGFEWPSDPSRFDQRLKLRGTLGEKYPAPFLIEGTADFATSKVGFDLQGEVPEGHVVDHGFLWEGLPVQVLDGKYGLKVYTLCKFRQLKSTSLLQLKSLRVMPRVSAGGLMWGLPMMATVGFLQSQKTIQLKVTVHGDIKDPQFEFPKAFRKAFQEALARHTRAGIRMIRVGSSRIASETQEIMWEAPTRFMTGIGKMTGRVTGRVPAMGSEPRQSPPGESEKNQKTP